MSASHVRLSRDVVAIDGADRLTFLQGLVSQDMERVCEDMSVYSALLTPQGKFLHDFFVMASGDRLLLDCEAGRGDDLIQRLSRFRLRADVQLSRLDNFRVSALFGPGATACASLSGAAGTTLATDGVIVCIDPRNEAIGCRATGPHESLDDYLSRLGVPEVDIASYEALRISLEIPDGSRDMEIEKSTLLECNFDELNGVDWEKGCYMGQELTARTKYRGLVKRRLSAFRATDASQKPGETVLLGDRKVGEIRSRSGENLLVSIRIDALEADGDGLSAAGNPLLRGTDSAAP